MYEVLSALALFVLGCVFFAAAAGALLLGGFEAGRKVAAEEARLRGYYQGALDTYQSIDELERRSAARSLRLLDRAKGGGGGAIREAQ